MAKENVVTQLAKKQETQPAQEKEIQPHSKVTRIVFGSSVQFMGGEQMLIDLINPQFRDVEMFFDGAAVFTLIDKSGRHNKVPRYVAITNVKSWD